MSEGHAVGECFEALVRMVAEEVGRSVAAAVSQHAAAIPATAPSGLPPTLSVERAAEVLGISRGAAYEAVRTGGIPSVRFGRRILVPTQRLMGLLA
jgi:excisionase family DNA binding protein